MFQNGLSGQVLFLLVSGFSLLIVVFSHCFAQDEPLQRMGSLFLTPLLFFVFLYLYEPILAAEILFIGAETLLALGILILLSIPAKCLANRNLSVILYILPLVVVVLSYLLIRELSGLVVSRYLVYANTILFIIALIQYLRRYKKASLLAPALLCLGASQPLILLANSPLNQITYVSLQGIGMGSFFIYFYQNMRRDLERRISGANQLIAEWDRSVKHEVFKRTIDFEHTQRRLLDINKMDGLVKCYNRAAIFEVIAGLIQKNQDFTLLMIDVDNFKEINDRLGHLAGDKVLIQVAARMQASIRAVDSLGRWGGDEFIIALPRTDIRDAMYVGKRIQEGVAEVMEHTLSIGIAAFPQDGDSVEILLETADKGLYSSKRRGRNTISHTGAGAHEDSPKK